MAKRRGNKLKNTIGHKSACKVILTRLGLENENYKKALFEYHGIRDLRVVVKRLPNETVATNPQRMKLSSVSKLNSVRFHVPWLPTITSTKSSAIENTKDLQQLKSAAAKRSQSSYHDQAANDDESGKSHDGTLQKVAAKRQRSTPITNDELHQELLEKVSTPNRNLRPVEHRSNPTPTSEPVPKWKKIFQEFQQKKAERERKNSGKIFSSDSA